MGGASLGHGSKTVISSGRPRTASDQFVVSEDNIFTGRLNALQVPKDERITERDGAPCSPDGQSEISWTNLHC